MAFPPRRLFPQVKTNDIFEEELIPLFFLSKYIGLFSYNNERKVSKLHITIGFIFHLLFASLVSWAILQIANMLASNKISFLIVQVITFALSHGMNLAIVINHIIIMYTKMETFQEIIDMLLYIDALWENHSIFYSKKVTKVGIAVLVLFYNLAPSVMGVRDRYIFMCISILCFTEASFFFILMQFSSFLDIIKEHLKKLRGSLEKDELHLVDCIGKHQILLKFCLVVNEAYSWQILLMCIKFFIFNCMMAYTIILDTDKILPNIIRVISLLWELGLVFSLAKCCSDIEDEADSFNNKLFNLMRESKDLCSNDKLHLYVTMKQSVSFTACGFFNLGYPLVTSIIAAATTYLVILVQFSMSN